jgi:uncharacterized protein YbjT (DUF2867 family)
MVEKTLAPVLVTGATGFTGGHLALTLCRLGHPVRALVREGAATGHLEAAGVHWSKGISGSATMWSARPRG